MCWLFRNLRFLFLAFTMEFVTANDQCRTEVNIQGMALKRSVFKRWSVATPYLCDVKCGHEIACQSYNYNKKKQPHQGGETREFPFSAHVVLRQVIER